MPRGTFQWAHPCGKPLLTHASTIDPPILLRWLWFSCGVIVPLLWVLVCAKFCLCPPRQESLFPPVLWKSYNQIPLVFKAGFPGDFQSLFLVCRLGSGVLNFHNSVRMSLVLLFSSLWVTHLAGMEFDFIMILPLLMSYCSFFFVFEHGVSFFGGFQHPPVNGSSRSGCNFGALTGGDEHMSFYSTFLTQKPLYWNYEEQIKTHMDGLCKLQK